MLGIDNKVFMESIVVTSVKLDDTNGTNWLTLDWNENDTSDRALYVKVNAGDRTIDLTGNLTVELASTLNQDLTTDASPTHAGLTLSGLNTANGIVQTDGSGVLSTAVDLPTATTIGTAYVYRVGGTDVAVADGGTNIGVYAVGDLLYASTTGILSKLADVAVGQYLASGGVNTAPAWATLNQAAVAGLTTADTPTFAGITAPIYNHGAFTTQTPSSGFTVDWSTNHFQQVTITGADLDITFTNPAGPCKDLLLIVIQGDGDDTIDWANEADLYAPGGVGPSLSTGSGDIDLVQFIWTGTYYICVANYNILQVT